jgi:cytochrome c oxidase subunit 3
MSNLIRHPYHIVDESPWPLVRAFGGFFITSGILFWFHINRAYLFFLGIFIIAIVMVQ